jgi:hypothetical protein
MATAVTPNPFPPPRVARRRGARGMATSGANSVRGQEWWFGALLGAGTGRDQHR